MEDALKPAEASKRVTNSLMDLASGIAGGGMDGFGSPFSGGQLWGQTISQPWTLRKDTTAGLLTLDWVTLSNAYAHIGLVQTLIDQPVEDALRGGFKVETNGQLDDEDLAALMTQMDEMGDITEVMQTTKWGRLFGGSGMLVDDGSDPSDDFSPKTVKKGKPLFFVSANRWELQPSFITLSGYQPNVYADGRAFGKPEQLISQLNYTFYDVTGINPERVKRVLGVPAPSWIRQQLSGWGMSELERCLREINSFLKFQDLLFELIDEAKIDVYKIQGFNDALGSLQGTAKIQARIQLSNVIKNFKNAIVMDTADEYEQKQLGTVFSGLAAIYEELRMNLSAALKIPMNKLFGTSASGLNASGEDAIENYNSLVETVRKKMEPLIKWVVSIRCQEMFGFVPDFTLKFASLRVMTSKEEEEVNTLKQARFSEVYDKGLLSPESFEELLIKNNLISVKLERTPQFRGDPEGNGDDAPADDTKPADARKNNAIVSKLETLGARFRKAA